MAERPIQLKSSDEPHLYNQLVQYFREKRKLKQYNENVEEQRKTVLEKIDKLMKQKDADAVYVEYSDEIPDPLNPKLNIMGRKSMRVTRVSRKKISWFIDKLEQTLGKQLCGKFIAKEYQITNWQEFASVLKKYDVPASEVLPFVNVIKTVDEKKLDYLSELGEINADDLEGCYSVEETSSYLQVDEFRTGGKKKS